MTEVKSDMMTGRGTGAGISSVGDALALAGVIPQAVAGRGVVECMTIGQALTSRATPAGPMLLELQGQADLQLVRNLVAKLVRRMAADGRKVSKTTQADAVGAGALALVQWRAGQVFADETLAARVAWRAVVDEVSGDNMGESVPLSSVGDDWLWQDAALPVPVVHGAMSSAEQLATRREQANILRARRLSSRRQTRLGVRFDAMPKGRGKRAEVVERVRRACVFLLQGERLDKAGELAGFKACGKGKGRQTAGDMFARAVRRLGFRFQFSARQSSGADEAPKSWRHVSSDFGSLVVRDEFGAVVFTAEQVTIPAFVPVGAAPLPVDMAQDSQVHAWHQWQAGQGKATPRRLADLAYIGATRYARHTGRRARGSIAGERARAQADGLAAWFASRRLLAGGRSCSFVPVQLDQHVCDAYAGPVRHVSQVMLRAGTEAAKRARCGVLVGPLLA